MSLTLNGDTGVSKIQDGVITPDGFSTSVIGIKAMGTFNGTAITSQKGCTVVNASTGIFNVTFTTPMPNANYAVVFGVYGNAVVPSTSEYSRHLDYINKTVSGFTIRAYTYIGSANDTVLENPPQSASFAVID